MAGVQLPARERSGPMAFLRWRTRGALERTRRGHENRRCRPCRGCRFVAPRMLQRRHQLSSPPAPWRAQLQRVAWSVGRCLDKKSSPDCFAPIRAATPPLSHRNVGRCDGEASLLCVGVHLHGAVFEPFERDDRSRVESNRRDGHADFLADNPQSSSRCLASSRVGRPFDQTKRQGHRGPPRRRCIESHR